MGIKAPDSEPQEELRTRRTWGGGLTCKILSAERGGHEDKLEVRSPLQQQLSHLRGGRKR